MEMAKNEICNVGGINFCFTGTFWPALYGHSYNNRGTQRRFHPKCIQNTFWATQSTFRSVEMLSKRRYEIYICSVILGQLESKFSGLQYYFSEKFYRCNLKFYERQIFSDSSYHCIFESEILDFLFLRKISLPKE